MTPSFLTSEEKQILVRLAHETLQRGVAGEKPDQKHAEAVSATLSRKGASFVTLLQRTRLRGCIGSLLAHRPLALDVMENAYNAAFLDYRFQPVQASDLPGLTVKISVLTPSEPMDFVSEADLLAQLRPGVDGLILRDGRHQATFLPSVWEQLPDPVQFLAHLKAKAGLSPTAVSQNLHVERYTTEEFS